MTVQLGMHTRALSIYKLFFWSRYEGEKGDEEKDICTGFFFVHLLLGPSHREAKSTVVSAFFFLILVGKISCR